MENEHTSQRTYSAATAVVLVICLCLSVAGCDDRKEAGREPQSGIESGAQVPVRMLNGKLEAFRQRVVWSHREALMVEGLGCKLVMPRSEGQSMSQLLRSQGYKTGSDDSLSKERAMAWFRHELAWQELSSTAITFWLERETPLTLPESPKGLRHEWLGFYEDGKSTICYFLIVDD